MLWVVSQAAPTHCWSGDAGWTRRWRELVMGPGRLRGMCGAVLVCAYWGGTALGCTESGWERGGCWLRVLGLSRRIPQTLGVSGEGSLRRRWMRPGGREASATTRPSTAGAVAFKKSLNVKV